MNPGVLKQISLDEEYKKKTGVTREDIRKFRDWLKTQPHLPEEHITDLDLILSYHCCGLSSAVSKEVLDLNITLRTMCTNIFKDRHVNTNGWMETAIRSMFISPLEKRTKEGYVVFYADLDEAEAKNFVHSDVLKVIMMVVDMCQYEEGTWPGIVIIFDLKNMNLTHMTKLELQCVQQFFYYLQEAMLVNLKGFHILNAPSFMDRIMLLVRPFMKKSLLDVFHIHMVGSKTLDEWFPIDALPNDTPGGTTKSSKELREVVLKKLQANREYFEQESMKRVTESLRPGKPKTITDIFGGVDGSFKSLQID